jgi:hypothetical protein
MEFWIWRYASQACQRHSARQNLCEESCGMNRMLFYVVYLDMECVCICSVTVETQNLDISPSISLCLRYWSVLLEYVCCSRVCYIASAGAFDDTSSI